MVCGLFVLAGCQALSDGSGEREWTDDEEIDVSEQAIRKGFPGATNGDRNYCDNPLELCLQGEGDCDSNAQCAGGLICGRDNAPKFGFLQGDDVCVPAHCENKVQDGDETSINCGGSCGSVCAIVCTTPPLPANGSNFHCTSDCPCPQGEGDCNGNSGCQAGLVCGLDNGPQFGFALGSDVCAPSHCGNGTTDGDETAIDCGGSCGNICPVDCNSPPLPANGANNHCTTDCPCPQGEGDCNATNQCGVGLVCGLDNGPKFGFAIGSDVCVPSHCGNGTRDGDETFIDCGGSCGATCVVDCGSLPASGAAGHCTSDCPCDAADGDCNNNSECAVGLACISDVGEQYGFGGTIDMCAATTCFDGVQNGDETEVDCGPSCGPCGGNLVNAFQFGNALGDAIEDVAEDSSGDVIVVGRFSGTLNLGGADLVSNGNQDVFLAKFTAAGVHMWSRSFGGVDADSAGRVALAVAANNSIVVAGSFRDSVDFGGQSGATSGATDTDGFVAKYNGNGTLAWLRTFGSNAGIDRFNNVTIASNGDVVAVGAFNGTVNLGGSNLTSLGDYDIVVARYNGSGTHIWSRALASTGADQANAVAVDSTGAVIVGAFLGASADLGTGMLTAQGQDALVAKLSSNGNTVMWARNWGGTSDDTVRGVGVDGSNRVYVAGRVKLAVDFGFGVTASFGASDAFAAILGSDGTMQWVDRMGGTGDDQGTDIMVDADGRFAVVGFFSTTAVVGGTSSLVSAGARDGFVSRFDSDGTHVWAEGFGGTLDDFAWSGAKSGRSIVFAGQFRDTIALGGGFTSAGLLDALVLRYVF